MKDKIQDSVIKTEGLTDDVFEVEFDEKSVSTLKDLTEADPPKLDFYEDFDKTIPPADEMFESIGKRVGRAIEEEERMRKRRARKPMWIASGSLAAAVAIVILVTTVYTPGAFMGAGDLMSEDSEVTVSENVGMPGTVGITDATPAELPAPQSDYDAIYDAVSEFADNNVMAQGSDVITVPAIVMEEPAAAVENGAPMPSRLTETADVTTEAKDNAPVAPEFSDTNVQTEGVQESDVVKTDGKYIYTANSESICITEARDGHPDVLSEIDQVTDRGQVYFEMYINGDTLTLIRTGYNNLKTKNGDVRGRIYGGSIAYPGSLSVIDTSVDIYDVSDRENPRKVNSLSQSGNYTDSRMIGDKLYLISEYGVSRDFIKKKDPKTYVPLFSEGSNQIVSKPGDIAMPKGEEYRNYTVISGIDTGKAKFVSHESILGAYYEVYASQDNLYLTSYESKNEEDSIGSYDIESYYEYTHITRLSLKDGKVKTEVSADVPGTVNDQFSLDEYKGHLRVVTTKSESVYASYTGEDDNYDVVYNEKYYGGEYYDEEGDPLTVYKDGTIYDEYGDEYEYIDELYDEDGNSITLDKDGTAYYYDIKYHDDDKAQVDKKYGVIEWKNDAYYGYYENKVTCLYILGMNLKTAGKVENLAPGEDVYSCRFMSDVAYFVTFRNTDPLFSVDVSNPKKPKVMDKLKIPGFSEYLHPYSNGLLFGLGKDADEDTGEVLSLKVSMFDNSNPYDVKEKDKLIIKDLYYSYAAENHKAILVDERKSLIAFPAEGCYVIIKYDKKTGFKRVMDVTLNVGNSYDDMYEWYNGLRGIFIGDVFYVVAPDSIHAYDMNNGFKAIDSVSLGSGAKYVTADSFELPPGVSYDDLPYVPIRAFGYGYGE